MARATAGGGVSPWAGRFHGLRLNTEAGPGVIDCERGTTSGIRPGWLANSNTKEVIVSSKLTRTCLAVAVATALLALTSCISVGERAQLVDLRTENKTVELGGAEEVEVLIDIGVGDCSIRSGSSALLTAEFTYNVEEWRPSVEYSVDDGKGTLTITQPDAEGVCAPNKAKNTWTLEFAEGVPLDIMLDMGVGEARLDLGDLRLTDLDIDHGVGELSVSLVGNGVGDLDGSIDGGVGEVRLLLPDNIGVRVDADTGIGDLYSTGFKKRNGYLVNEAYDRSEQTIDLNVDAGVGSITVEASSSSSASM
jgi:hypothetical protein